jgi:hypothetical protein
MQKINIFFRLLLIIWIITVSNLHATVICIDPGHGGPGASKFGYNGDGFGSSGPSPDPLSEQWVNLQVALELKDFISLDLKISYHQKGVIVYNRWCVFESFNL